MLAQAGPDLIFRHALIRQALHDELPAAVRVGLHAHVARVLAEAGAAWDRVAQHLLAAPQAIDGWVLTWLADLPAAALVRVAGHRRRVVGAGPAGQPAR